jgi:hypothetical protein
VLGRSVLGRSVLGRSVLGRSVLGRSVLGRSALGRSGASALCAGAFGAGGLGVVASRLLALAEETDECGDEVVHFVHDDVVGSLQIAPGLGDVECGEDFACGPKRRFVAGASSAAGTAGTLRQIEQNAGGGTPELRSEISVMSSDAHSDWTKPDQHTPCALVDGQVR